MIPNLAKLDRVWLGVNGTPDERWVQDCIANDPSILGLGGLLLKDRERSQPRAGRLDLLLQDLETLRRYEVEIQLGATDERHIVRTIEYWDIERKRYPQYDHCAVIVAETINARFLNIISLFNGTIPIIALQMSAYRIGVEIALLFTTVLDENPRGLVDDDEPLQATTDKNYWETQASPEMVTMANEILMMIRTLDPEIELNYKSAHIGLIRRGRPDNFIWFNPKKKHLRMAVRLKQTPELSEKLERSELDLMEYDARNGAYRFRLSDGEIGRNHELLLELLRRSFEENL